MNTPNAVLMSSARETLKGKWRVPIKVTVIYFLISMLLRVIPIIGPIISIAITGPLAIGLVIYFLSFSRSQDPSYRKMFEGFDMWWRYFKAYFLVGIYILLWILLLIIPGIIAAYSYSQTFYILAEDKNISIDDAIMKSKKMMMGNKMKLFLLGLRFIGWVFLCILTFGIGFIWLVPYIQVTMAKFYDDVKGEGPVVPEVMEVPIVVPTPQAQPAAI